MKEEEGAEQSRDPSPPQSQTMIPPQISDPSIASHSNPSPTSFLNTSQDLRNTTGESSTDPDIPLLVHQMIL